MNDEAGCMAAGPFFFMGGRGCGPFGGHHHRAGPAWWLHHVMGGPQRAERGEVRYLILDALKEGPRHGYEVIQAIEERSRGTYRPSPGAIYPTLQMLEELGHARSREAEGRRVYELTAEGKKDLEAHRAEVDEAYERMCGGACAGAEAHLPGLWPHVERMMRSIGGSVRRGRLGPDEFRAIGKVIDDAIRRIEEIAGKR